jgi:hypothetical protein
MAMAGVSVAQTSTWAERNKDSIESAKTLLFAAGSTAILLYQRKIAAVWEQNEHVRETARQAAIDAVRVKLEVDATTLANSLAITLRQVEAEGATTREQLSELVQTHERSRCRFPLADGSARGHPELEQV